MMGNPAWPKDTAIPTQHGQSRRFTWCEENSDARHMVTVFTILTWQFCMVKLKRRMMNMHLRTLSSLKRTANPQTLKKNVYMWTLGLKKDTIREYLHTLPTFVTVSPKRSPPSVAVPSARPAWSTCWPRSRSCPSDRRGRFPMPYPSSRVRKKTRWNGPPDPSSYLHGPFLSRVK